MDGGPVLAPSYRLEVAALEPAVRVDAVGEIGLNTEARFSRAVRRASGCSPSESRQFGRSGAVRPADGPAPSALQG